MTKIEWANETWNPITGCSPISEGCVNCYAARMSKRLAGRFGYPADNPFSITLHEDKLNVPLDWTEPRKIFVCSMGDLFHTDVPFEWVDRVFSVMSEAPQHTYMLLTKRPGCMKKYIESLYDDWEIQAYHRVPFNNLWLGVTAENQEMAENRIPILLQIPAAKRFVSIEPMLSEINLSLLNYDHVVIVDALNGHHGVFLPLQGNNARLDWVICGAETGPRKRPMENAWAESLREQCEGAGIPFFFKKDSCGNNSLNSIIYNDFPQAGGTTND